MKEVTIICCYNNLKQYKTFTESLAKQTTECELIGIDNTKKANIHHALQRLIYI